MIAFNDATWRSCARSDAPTGDVNTAYAGGGTGHEVVAAVANAYGFVWGKCRGRGAFCG